MRLLVVGFYDYFIDVLQLLDFSLEALIVFLDAVQTVIVTVIVFSEFLVTCLALL